MDKNKGFLTEEAMDTIKRIGQVYLGLSGFVLLTFIPFVGPALIGLASKNAATVSIILQIVAIAIAVVA